MELELKWRLAICMNVQMCRCADSRAAVPAPQSKLAGCSLALRLHRFLPAVNTDLEAAQSGQLDSTSVEDAEFYSADREETGK